MAGAAVDLIPPIKTERDYEQAIAEIAGYFEHQPEPGTSEGDRFDALAAAIEAYEDRHYPMPPVR
jgi:HTH-type transcriptional regulator/antitoxin HigA